MVRRLDAVVLGAGIAGTSAAKALADHGWETLLIDRKSFPRHKVCGEFLSPESQGFLHALGLKETVDSLRPSLMESVNLFSRNGYTLEVPLPGNAYGISRYALDAALQLEACKAGVEIHTEEMVTAVIPHGDKYRIETNRGGAQHTYEARVVIAAWGAQPNTKLQKPSSAKREAMQYFGVKSHFTGVEQRPAVELYFVPGGYVGISSIENQAINVAALVERSTFHGAGSSILHIIEAAARCHPTLSDRLANAVPVAGTQVAVAPVDLKRPAAPWGQFPYIGDAVVHIPPLCGDGMSMALYSAQLCSTLANSYLCGDLSLSQWRQSYCEQIEQQFKGPLRWGRLLQRLIDSPAMPDRLLSLGRLAPMLAYRMVQATRLSGK